MANYNINSIPEPSYDGPDQAPPSLLLQVLMHQDQLTTRLRATIDFVDSKMGQILGEEIRPDVKTKMDIGTNCIAATVEQNRLTINYELDRLEDVCSKINLIV